MTRAFIAPLLAIALACSQAVAADTARRVAFGRGSSSATLTGAVKGYDTVSYLVGARAGQTLTVTLHARNHSTYFSVTAPGADAAMFMGEVAGDTFTATLPSSGDYRVQVYLMRNAARRGDTGAYTISVRVR